MKVGWIGERSCAGSLEITWWVDGREKGRFEVLLHEARCRRMVNRDMTLLGARAKV